MAEEAVSAVRITAKNETGATFAAIERGAQGVVSSVTAMRTAIGALGGALSVGAISAWAKDTVAAAAELQKLSTITGSTVESLSRLSNIAKVSGTDFGTFQTMLTRMTASMAGVDEASSQGARALQFLGVSARDPASALQEVATQLNKYADGASKAALARDLFGRGGAQFLETLKDMAEAHAVGATITARQAEEADRLEKAIRRLGVEATTFKNILLSDVVPAINNWIEGFKKAREAGLGIWASLDVGTTFADRIQPRIEATAAQIEELKRKIGSGQTGVFGPLVKDLEDAQKKLAVLIKMRDDAIMQNVSRMGFTGDARDLKLAQKPDLGYSGAAQGAAKVDEFARALENLRKSAAVADAELLALTAQTKDMVPAQKALIEIMSSDLWKKAPQAWRDQYEAMAKAEIATQQQTRDFKALGDAAAEFAEKMRREREEWERQISNNREKADELVRTLEEEVRVQGLSNEARALSNELLKLEALGITEATDGYDEYVRRVTEAVIAKEAFARQQLALKEQAEAFRKTYDEISNTISDALMRGFESGKDWARNFIDTLKNMFGNLVLRPVIQAIISPVAGGLAGLLPGAANAAGLSGAAGSLGGIAGLFGASDFTAALAGDAFLPGALGAGGGGAAGLGSTFGAGLGAAAPYLAGALAIYGIAKMLSKSGGGPRVQGYAEAGLFTGGPPSGWSTPDNTLKSTVQPVVDQIGASYADLVKKLGGSGAGGFALRIDTDPKGKALGGIGVSAQVGGKTVYMSDPAKLGDYVGRSDAEMTAAMQLEGKKAILAALKASSLPGDIARILDAVDVATATSEQIDKLFQVATAIGQINDAVDSLGNINETLDKLAGGNLVDIFREQGNALDKLITNFDGSTTATDELAAASGAYYQSLIALEKQIRDVTAQIDKMFAGTRETINTTGRDNDWLYNYYQQDAENQKKLLSTLTDPNKIAEASAKANDDFLKAFQLLSPEDQAGMREQFLQGIDEFNRAADDRLRELGANAENAFKSDMAEVKELLTGLITDMKTAANTQLTAGNIQLAAATSPITVIVTDRAGNEIGGG